MDWRTFWKDGGRVRMEEGGRGGLEWREGGLV